MMADSWSIDAFVVVAMVFVFASNGISAIFGVGGGILSLGGLSLAFDLKTAIPLHGFLQVMGNFSRLGFFFRHVDLKAVIRFGVLLYPGILVGSWIFQQITSAYLECWLGLAILANLVFPWSRIPATGGLHVFLPLGFVAGLVSMVFGVSGPFIAPFFYHAGYQKHQFVATKGACQFLCQVLKVHSFYYLLDYDFAAHAQLLTYMTVAVILGTVAGKRLLDLFQHEHHEKVGRWIIAVIALKFVITPFIPYLKGTFS